MNLNFSSFYLSQTVGTSDSDTPHMILVKALPVTVSTGTVTSESLEALAPTMIMMMPVDSDCDCPLKLQVTGTVWQAETLAAAAASGLGRLGPSDSDIEANFICQEGALLVCLRHCHGPVAWIGSAAQLKLRKTAGLIWNHSSAKASIVKKVR